MDFFPQRRTSDGSTLAFEELTAQVLAQEDDRSRGFTSYDLISRTLHQLARDGNHRVLALALNRLGEQSLHRINQLDDQQMTPLHYAARYSHPYTVLTLLQRRANVNSRGQFELTPLHCAARYRKSLSSARKRRSASDRNILSTTLEPSIDSHNDSSEESAEKEIERDGESLKSHGSSIGDRDSVIKLLVENGADLNARDAYGLTPLHYAAMRGNDVAAQDLLAFDNVNIEARDKQMMTPLFIAATYGYVDICRLLVDRGAIVSAADESGQSPLHKAAAEGHLDIVELLLDKAFQEKGTEATMKFLSLLDAEKQTPLYLAVLNGNVETVSYLLSNGASANVVRDTLATPLHAASVIGNKEIINLLIQYEAYVDAVDSNQHTPLHKAAANDQTEAITILLDCGAKIERKDRNGFTPLLMAVWNGHITALEVLLSRGARLDVVDKDDKSAIMWCAELGHAEVLKILIEKEEARSLVDLSDTFDNSPLHLAARNGYMIIVELLLKKGSQIDNKNEDEETALHIAAEHGQTDVIKTLLNQFRYLVNDENEDGDSPLHLAASNGHCNSCEVLLKASADVSARNTLLWTPLDSAAANGHVDVCKLLIDHGSPMDPLDKSKMTPLQLAARKGHADAAELLLKKGASVSAVDASGKNALEIAIAAGQHDVAMAIVRSSQWLSALRSIYRHSSDGYRKTPLRSLIHRFPDVAKVALDRCITTNGLESEDLNFGLQFNFEFVDDTYVEIGRQSKQFPHLVSETDSFIQNSAFDENGKLWEESETYTDNARILRNNHPLSLMIKYHRSELLGHPLSVALLKHKWKSYVRYVYYFNLVFYCVFLAFLTGYISVSIDQTYANFLIQQRNISIADYSCKEIMEVLVLNRTSFYEIATWAIIIMTAINILQEIFQLCQARFSYFGLGNLIEWFCYVGAIILVVNWSDDPNCLIKENWQWQLGSCVIFIAWINLVLFIRRLPFFGIYVVMFTDILVTFSRFFAVFFLFIVGFALSFHMLFRSQVSFYPWSSSILKTSVMMIGEFEFDSIFNSSSVALQYPVASYILFVLFLVIMSILIMNLLIGLAVDDIKVVQEQAVLKRRAMQAQLVIDVEMAIPENFRRYFATPFKKVFPNQDKSPFKKIFRDFDVLQSMDYRQLNPTEVFQQELLEHVSRLQKEVIKLKMESHKAFNFINAVSNFNTAKGSNGLFTQD